jgi:arylsulfatase A-like enzyme
MLLQLLVSYLPFCLLLVAHQYRHRVDVGYACCRSNDDASPHAVTNFSAPTPDDDSTYLADAFTRFVEGRAGKPFLAQLSFHNCHIPYIGTNASRAACAANKTCVPPLPGTKPYNDAELDFYACLNELDGSVGRVLDMLVKEGYYDNTMIWMTTDNVSGLKLWPCTMSTN